MSIQIYNTLSKRKEEFKPLEPGKVKMYVFFALCDIALGDHAGLHTLFIGLLDDLVIHVCEVGYIVYFVTLVFHVTAHRIKYDHGGNEYQARYQEP